MGFLSAADRHSPLASHLEAKTRDLDWTLANFAFVANATALASECDIAHSPTMSVASCRSLPKLGLAFVGDSSDLLATYAAFLADPGSALSLLVNEDQRPIVERAFEVTSVVPRWQMLYRGDSGGVPSPSVLDDSVLGPVAELVSGDLAAVQALVKAEKTPLRSFSDDPFHHGPAFGVWDRRKLVAIGTTTVRLPGAAQIDNVVTRKEFRRQGYATAIVSALLHDHLSAGRSVFVIVDQDNVAALRLFEKLGFARERPLYAMGCILGTPLDAEA